VVGTRLWAERRTMKALEAAGFETCTAEQLRRDIDSDQPGLPSPELACVVRTDNSPTVGARVTSALGRLEPRVALVVVGVVAFHPFEDRALGQIALTRLTPSALAALPVELSRFIPRLLARGPFATS